MSTTPHSELTPDLIDRVMSLTTADKDKLVDLLVTGGSGPPDDPDAGRDVWRAEFARRIEDIRAGRITPIDARQALADARQRLRHRYGL